LTIFTSMMVWLGVLVLSYTKSRRVSLRRAWRAGSGAKGGAEGVMENTLSQKLDGPRQKFMLTRAFSFRNSSTKGAATSSWITSATELDR